MRWCLLVVAAMSSVEAYTSSKPQHQHKGNGPLRVVHEWSTVDFIYSSAKRKDDQLLSRQYIPENIVVIDVDVYTGKDGGKKVFVTTPNVLAGTPFTLSVVSPQEGLGGPSLKPFPDEHWHARTSCDSIVSAFRIKIDKKGRLWVLDNGVETAFAGRVKKCEPQILAFDLNNNNKLIKRYRLPKNQSGPLSLYVNIEVEATPDDTWVYLADPVNYRMVCYQMSRDTSHYISHPYFYPDPLYGFYELNGVNFTLMDGILALALGQTRSGGGHNMFFHSLSSGREGQVRTELLKAANRTNEMDQEFKLSIADRRKHVSVEVITGDGVMIFASLEDNALVAWDTRTEYKAKNFKVLVQDRKNLQFPSGMKIIGDDLYILTSRIQNVMVGQVPKNEINYRVVVAKIDALLSRSPVRPFI